MKILVTGGAGFIGSHVVDAYIAEGHSVIVVDNLSSGSLENVNPKATFYKMDIRSSEIEDLFRGETIDVVNHHAAQMDVRRSVADPKFDADVNVLGGLNIFENARKYGVKKIIFASTGGAIYGEQEYFPADEDHPTRPLSPYGITKLTTEKYLYFYKTVYGINYVVLRYGNVYGPRQNPHGEAGVVAIFCSKLIKGEQPIINGNGTQTRDYVYVGDVVSANVMALHTSRTDVYNVGTGRETDVNTLFSILRDILRPSCPEQHGPAKVGEQMRSVISPEKIHRVLGWKPTVTLEQGLRLTADYFKQRLSK
ncbi:MAG: GDP-mannose 4,6-dehydratase [Bacteroidetes bacterium]|nr:GDP-mannose 4,6-dehydratase [Bacteroidota bacterium]